MIPLASRRRFVIALGTFVMSLPGMESRAEEKNERQDGFWWDQENIIEKLAFVNGFVTMSAKAFSLIPFILKEAGIHQNASFAALATENFDFTGIAYGQYLEGVDKFYKDFRNQRIQVEDAMHYVRGEIRGRDPKKLESEVLALRRFAASE